MKIHSTKSFLSFLVYLVICIVHSLTSLPTSHILHRRMEEMSAVEAGKLIGEGPEMFKPNPVGSGGLEATNDMKTNGGSKSFSRPIKKDRGELHLGQKSTSPTWRETWNHYFERVKSVLSWIQQKISGYLKRFNKKKSESTFSPNLGILDLVRSDESTDKKVDGFMKTFKINEHPEGEDVNLHSLHEQNVKKPKDSLRNLRHLFKKYEESLDKLETADLEFSEKVKSMLLEWNEGLDAGEVLGQRLAAYQSKSLAEAQKVLSKKLPENQRYLSAFYGHMGPHNVLKPWFRAVIKEKVESHELELVGDDEEFLSELVHIQNYLASLATLHRTSDLSAKEAHQVALYNNFISRSEDKLVAALSGGRDKFQRALEMIENTDFHQEFMKQLKSPSKAHYYDLQFLEPFGKQVQDMTKEEKIMIYNQLGIKSEEANLETIMNRAPFARVNYKSYLDTYLKFKDEQKNVLKIITPEDIKRLSEYNTKRLKYRNTNNLAAWIGNEYFGDT